MKNFFLSVTAKIIFIGFLILLLFFPLSEIEYSISNREYRQIEAKDEVSEKWGKAQKIFGPILIIPVDRIYTETFYDKGKEFFVTKKEPIEIFFLPENLQVNSKITPEIRSRGIFKVPLYRSKIKIEGEFLYKNLKQFLEKNEDLKIKQNATLSLGFSDEIGIETPPKIFLKKEQEKEFFPGTKNEFWKTGVHTEISDLEKLKNFTIDLNLKGYNSFTIVPAGKNTNMHMESSWPTPSFFGKFLPKKHEISDKGFVANWDIPYFSRNFPQIFLTKNAEIHSNEIHNSDFGVEFFIPVDFYQKNERAIKYSVLFIILTFGSFFVFEILQKLKIHPIQYLAVGAAICIFYLLFLAFSEHIGFFYAYILSASATIFLISIYSFFILKSLKNATAIAGILCLFYIYLFFLLQMEDFAFLFGAIFLFLILALFMFLTRKIDWYKISFDR